MKILLAVIFIFFSFLLQAQDKVKLIKQGKFYGLATENGEEIIQPVYDTVIPVSVLLDNEPAADFYYVRESGKYGLYVITGLKILEAIYDTIYPINYCVVGVKNNQKFLFSLTGTCLPSCDYVLQYYDRGYIFSKDKKYFLYDNHMRFFVSLDSVSKELPLNILEDSIVMRDNPMIRKYPAMRNIGLSRFITFDGEKYGIYDYKNQEIFTPQFTDVQLSDDKYKYGAIYLLAHKDSLYYIIDTTGKTIFKSKYRQMEYFPKQGCIIINLYAQYGDEFIIIKPDGSQIIKDTFSTILPGFGSQFIATYPSGWKNLPEQQKTVFNSKGKIIIPAAYEEISMQESYEFYTVTKYNYNAEFGVTESRVGLIDTSGKILIPCHYSSIELKNSDYAKVVMEVKNYHKYINKNRKFKDDYLSGLVSLKGKVLFLTDEYEEFGEFHEGLSIAKLNSAYAETENNESNSEEENTRREREFFYINMNGKRHGKADFDYCTDFENGTAVIMNFNDERDSITGEETVTLDVIDKESIWFRNPKKASETRKTNFNASLSNSLVRLISKDFVLFDLKDSCTLIRKDPKGNFKQENYQSYQILPFDPSPMWPYQYVIFLPEFGQPLLPHGFALMKNAKYALFGEDGKECSGFEIDAIDLTNGIKIVIGNESGYINEYFEVLKWEGKNPPVFRRNKLSKQKLTIKPKPMPVPQFYFHYN